MFSQGPATCSIAPIKTQNLGGCFFLFPFLLCLLVATPVYAEVPPDLDVSCVSMRVESCIDYANRNYKNVDIANRNFITESIVAKVLYESCMESK